MLVVWILIAEMVLQTVQTVDEVPASVLGIEMFGPPTVVGWDM